MDDSKGYSRFKIAFHLFIFIFAIGLIIASIAGWNEMDHTWLYLILGIVFAGESVFSLYKYFNYK